MYPARPQFNHILLSISNIDDELNIELDFAGNAVIATRRNQTALVVEA